MKSRILISCLVAGALMSPFVGHAADRDSDRSSAKAFVKDSVITTKIKSQLAEEKMSSLVLISVDTDANGMVHLSGTAASQAAVVTAVPIARNVKGVKSVQNTIQVKADK
jgi:hyperosmotically inducible periplasmic protein